MNDDTPLKAIPILDPEGSPVPVSNASLTPRVFCDLMDRHKALVFRAAADHDPLSVEDFGRFVVDRRLTEYPYVGGAAPRRVIPVRAAPDRDVVFTANER